MRSHRTTTTTVLAMTLALGLAACGGEDEPEATTPVTTPSASAPAATTDASETTDAPAVAEETTEESADVAEETTEAAATNEDGVPPLEEVYATAMENAREAESVSATLEGFSDGVPSGITLHGQLDDSNFRVEVLMGDGKVTLIGDEGEFYLNGTEEFWTDAAGVPSPELVDRWVVIPPETGVVDQYGLGVMWESFLSDMPQSSVGLTTSTAERTDLDGVEAYRYVLDGEDVQIWIDAQAEHFLRVVMDEGGEEPTVMTAQDWDEAEPVDPPADAVPMQELLGG